MTYAMNICGGLAPDGRDDRIVEIRIGRVVNADFLVCTWRFAQGTGGEDLDIRTRLIEPVLGPENYIGWCRSTLLSYLRGGVPVVYVGWAGDNTDYGVESVLINLREILTDFPGQSVKLEVRAFWFDRRDAGNVDFEAVAYLGGVMQIVGFGYVNAGGENTATLSWARNVSQAVDWQNSDDQQRCAMDGELVGTLIYNPTTQRLTLS